MKNRFVPFVLILTFAFGAAVASAQGPQKPPKNTNGGGGASTQGCGTQGSSGGCKVEGARVPTLADLRYAIDLVRILFP
jgi:hypothetical protein